MTSLLTTWGYTIKDMSALPDLLTVGEFDDFTADKYAGDVGEEKNIEAASMAVRNYCGWHVYPSAACKLATTYFDGRVTRVGSSVMIQLPARYVTSIESVEIDNKEYDLFVFEPNGLLKVYGVMEYLPEYAPVFVEYTAGLPDELMYSVKELVAHRITHALASSDGVQSETAGGVSITYSANWTNSARATALADDNKEVLAPYKLQGVF